MSGAHRRIVTVACVLSLVPLAACRKEAVTPVIGAINEGAATTAVGLPKVGGKGSVADKAPAPTVSPAGAAASLAGQALPTNQWWTSALTGSLPQPLWAHPLAIKNTAGGIAISSAAPAAAAKAVITPFEPALTLGGPISKAQVVGYGAFHVVLNAEFRDGGSARITLVQGSPLLYLDFQGVAPSVTGIFTRAGNRLTIAGQRWDVMAEDGADWKQEGNKLTAAKSTKIAVARVPDGVNDKDWSEALAGAASDPVTDTTSSMAYDSAAGTVTQTLEIKRKQPAVWALLPHQQASGAPPMAGTFEDARGKLTLTRGTSVHVKVPMPGLITEAPPIPRSAAILSDLDRDLADKAPSGNGGSYFGLKELGRLSTIAEVAKGVGATAQRDAALQRLRAGLVEWLTYGGPDDKKYFAYDRTWGGLIAVPAEFGSNDYNDHHFQYGYLVRAAAVMAEADPAFLRDYGGVVSLVARDYSGTLSAKGANGFPPFRAFNAYLGHSAASGFAPFADGNNQESSSEAVAAWEAVARWGMVTKDDDLTAYGMTHYALEAATARMYWLGEGLQRPAGYRHANAGIVWDAKIDYATWFDPKPESILGIQLLPLTFGSLYRMDAKQAAARSTALAAEAGGQPRVWGDLFAADLAVADPAAAKRRLTASLPREESTSRAMVRYWVEMLATKNAPALLKAYAKS